MLLWHHAGSWGVQCEVDRQTVCYQQTSIFEKVNPAGWGYGSNAGDRGHLKLDGQQLKVQEARPALQEGFQGCQVWGSWSQGSKIPMIGPELWGQG